jgi:hypothetical protein
MIQLGTALKINEPPFHRCLILSDPATNGGQIVLVRVTADDGTWPDRDCILTPMAALGSPRPRARVSQ